LPNIGGIPQTLENREFPNTYISCVRGNYQCLLSKVLHNSCYFLTDVALAIVLFPSGDWQHAFVASLFKTDFHGKHLTKIKRKWEKISNHLKEEE
jgi:hypothetical protein